MYSLVLVVSYVLMFFYFKAFIRPTPYTFICLISLLYFGIGTIFLEIEDGFTPVVLSVHIFLLSLSFFILVHKALSKIYMPKVSNKEFNVVHISTFTRAIIYALTFVCMLLLLYQLLFLNPFMQGGGLEEARVKIVFENKLVFYNLLLLAPVLLIFAYVCNLKIKTLFLVLIVLTSLSTGFRSILVNVLAIFIFYYYSTNNVPFTRHYKRFIVILIIVVAFLVSVTLFRTDAATLENLTFASSILVDRLFILNLRNVENIINYHSYNDLFYGFAFYSDISSFFTRLLSPLGAERLDTYAEFITKKLNPTGNHMFIMTPTIVGVSYADFGYLGGFISGFIVFILALIISPLKKTKLGLPFYCYFCYVIGVMATRGIPATIALYIIPIFGLYIILNIINLYSTKRR